MTVLRAPTSIALAAGFAIALSSVFSVRASQPAPPAKLVIVSWDGSADWVVDRLLDEGKLPNLARLAETGVRAEQVRPAEPSKTAPGHAALWTGAYSNVNLVSGNSVPRLPREGHTVLETVDGFQSSVLRAEPIWMPALLAGKRVVSLSATHMTPPVAYLSQLDAAGIPRERFVSFDGFRTGIAPAGTIHADDLGTPGTWSGLDFDPVSSREAAISVGDQLIHVLAYDAADDPVIGLDTVAACVGTRHFDPPSCVSLKPVEADDGLTGWSRPVPVTLGSLFGQTYFRLFSLSPDGSEMTLYQRAAAGLASTLEGQATADYLAAAGGFVDEGFAAYEDGRFGPPLWDLGDGTAERRVLEIVRLDLDFHSRATLYALDRFDPDILMHYSSASDSAGHTWMGVLDPESPVYDPDLAARLRPFYEAVFQLQDEWLGTIMARVDERTIVTVVGDHGMVGAGRRFYPDVVLERAGLLVRNPDGSVDLDRTEVLVSPWNEFGLTLNSSDWRDGSVAFEERPRVIAQTRRVLSAFTDPDTGRPVVTGIVGPENAAAVGTGGPAGSDLRLELAPGYVPRAGSAPAALFALESPGSGEHGFSASLRKMQTVWILAGPGVRSGVRIGAVRQIDIAPTLARLLGIRPPADAVGRIVGEAFVEGLPD